MAVAAEQGLGPDLLALTVPPAAGWQLLRQKAQRQRARRRDVRSPGKLAAGVCGPHVALCCRAAGHRAVLHALGRPQGVQAGQLLVGALLGHEAAADAARAPARPSSGSQAPQRLWAAGAGHQIR